MATDHAPPSCDQGRYLTFIDAQKTTDIPIDTLFTWHRLILAMGHQFGQKIRGVWNFSPHELYQFNVAAALSTAGHPVGIEQLRQIIDGTKEPGRPTGSLFLTTKSTFAIVAVNVVDLWDLLAGMLERAVDAE
ncbi:hypothetical protein P9A16_07120 [Shinella sp. 838]|uniref:hypothetical protein n=1 Tax=Shinella sp. 838 TaxID=3038164 RepID=UPI00241552A1|nr:hypothetical protein [Shinella sp. 838]MDG4670888.1 hypothetical protein [Shinella sp. 838]